MNYKRNPHQLLIKKIFFLLGLTFSSITNADTSALYSYKSLNLDLANQAAVTVISTCRKLGYSVAVTIVDRGGNVQVTLRDRFAGPHTVETATRKAWTANSFRQSTSTLAQLLKENKIPSQVQHNPGALLVGGGEVIQAQGETIGGIGVSGAPPGKSEKKSIDGQCAIAGLLAIQDELEFSQ